MDDLKLILTKITRPVAAIKSPRFGLFCVIQVKCNYSSMPRGLAKTPLPLVKFLIHVIYASVN